MRTRGETIRYLPAVLVAAVLVFISTELLPVLLLLFPLPLFYVLFSHGRRSFVLALILSYVSGVAYSLLFMSRSFNDAVFSPLFLFAPLVFFAFPGKNTGFRALYRLLCAALLFAVIWFVFVTSSGFLKELDDLILSTSDTVFRLTNEMTAEGGRAFGREILSAAQLYDILWNTLLYSLMPMALGMYAFSWRVGRSIACRIHTLSHLRYSLADFYCGRHMVYLAAFGMVCIVTGRLTTLRLFLILGWNLLASASFICMLQGAGILQFMLRFMRSAGRRIPRVPLFVFAAFTVFYGWPVFLLALLIVGVLECFIPLRKRFINTERPSLPGQ